MAASEKASLANDEKRLAVVVASQAARAQRLAGHGQGAVCSHTERRVERGSERVADTCGRARCLASGEDRGDGSAGGDLEDGVEGVLSTLEALFDAEGGGEAAHSTAGEAAGNQWTA